jgi:hypothetical protein
MTTDEKLCELINGAYADLHATTPLAAIESAARRRPRRRAAAWTAAATFGTVGVIAATMSPGRVPATLPTAASATTGSAQPSVSAGTCTLTPNSIFPTMPPLRFDVQLDGGIRLQLFAEEHTSASCLITGANEDQAVNISRGGGAVLHEPGKLSCSSSLLQRGDYKAGYAFGGIPAGTTGVEVFFHDNTSTAAQVSGGWYLATGTGAQADRFGDVTKVVAQTPAGPQTLHVREA